MNVGEPFSTRRFQIQTCHDRRPSHPANLAEPHPHVKILEVLKIPPSSSHLDSLSREHSAENRLNGGHRVLSLNFSDRSTDEFSPYRKVHRVCVDRDSKRKLAFLERNLAPPPPATSFFH